MRKFCDPFFFADVSSSGITTSFQQVHLERSEAPSELQVIHSERVVLERPGALCSTLEGVECQHSSGAKHRSCSDTKLNPGSRLQYLRRTRGLHPGYRLLWPPLRHTIYMGKRVQNPRPNRVRNSCSRDAFAMRLRETK